MQTTAFTSPYFADESAIERKRKLAAALQSQAMQPMEQAPVGAGQFATPISPWQSAAKLAQAFVGAKNSKKADEQQRQLAEKVGANRTADMTTLANALQPAQQIQPDPQEVQQSADQGTPAPVPGAVPGTSPQERLQQALGQLRDPQMQQQAMGIIGQYAAANVPKKPDAYTLKPGETRYGPNGEILNMGAPEKPEGAFALAPGHTRYGPDGKPIVTAPDKSQDGQPVTTATVIHRGVPTVVDARRYKGEGSDVGVIGPANKPANTQLPGPALKEVQENQDAIGISAGINADLGAIITKLNPSQDKDGKQLPPVLNLGPVSNLINRGRNFAGQSNQESRALESFQSTLEKMRNDSLRLNKGTQTEGDAQRAWNELMSGINDQENVKNRLSEIQHINERAVRQRQMQIDLIRKNYGLEPQESPMANQPPAINGGAPRGRVNWSDL